MKQYGNINPLARRAGRTLIIACATALAVGMAGAAGKPAPHAAPAPAAASTVRVAAPVGTPARSAVLRDLLAGKDARAAVAEARAHPELRMPSAVHADAERAFGAYADALGQLQYALVAAGNAWTTKEKAAAHARLLSALNAVQAQRLLVDGRIAQIDQRVSSASMPALARQRWSARRDALASGVAALDDAVTRTKNAMASADPAMLPSLGEIAALVTAQASSAAPPVYGATPPVFRPRLAPRDPVTSPAITPTYADASSENLPVAADYAASDDTPLSPAILDQAQSLGHDYTRILDFVRSQVRTQWYSGAQKGAETTLRTLAGNDVDQASLLIALLRASGSAAHYVRGVVDVPVGDLAAALGVRQDEVGLALGAAGVPNRPVISAGRISGFAIEQVYVSAFLPFANYRGSAADLAARTWVPLMPAIKPHAFAPAAGVLGKLGIGSDDFVAHYLAAPQTLAPLDLLRQQVSDALSRQTPPAAYADQLAQLSVSAPALELLPASTPVAVEAVTGEFAALPETLRQHAHIVVRSGADASAPVVLDATLPITQLIGRRTTLAYMPASIDDGRIADRSGGLGGVPPYLVHVRPVLNVAGLPAVAGTGEIETGSTHRLEITLDAPAGSVNLMQQVTAGGMAALVVDAQTDGPPQQSDATVLPGESESEAAKVLANFGARYLSSWDLADDELARLIGVGVVRPLPSVALVINQYRVDSVGGVADAMVWRGVGLDAALRPVEPFTQVDALTTSADWMQLAALQGSVLEHQLFEQQWSVDSISADKGLALARANNTPVLTLTQATGTAGVNQAQSVLDAIGGWLAQGYVVDVPRDPLTYEDWTGAVWRVHALATGESGYFIAGNLAGGSTAMPPELWYFQDLVGVLGNPYGQEPDQDPLSGVAITLDQGAQYQDGVVGSTLPRTLNAIIVDAATRPVLGAQVTYTVVRGPAKLIDADGNLVTTATYATDRNGVAAPQLKLDNKQGNFGTYRLVPNQTYPQWVGYNLIEVSATAKVGTLVAGEPYSEFALPDVPSKLKLVGSSDAQLVPSIGYVGYLADATDKNDNEVSNVALTLSANTASSCTDGRIDAKLFIPGQCPTDQIQLTGSGCASTSIPVTSRPGGAPFFIVPPNTGNTTVTIVGSGSGLGGDSVQLQTDDLDGSCKLPDAYVAIWWGHSLTHGLAPLQGDLNVLDAAPPGSLMPVPQRVDIYKTDTSGSADNVVWTPYDKATLHAQLTNGSIENAHSVGSGMYLQDLRAGPVAGAIQGFEYATVDTQQQIPLRQSGATKLSKSIDPNLGPVWGWSVSMQPPNVTPQVIALTPFGTTADTVHVASAATPGDYVGVPVQIDILQDGDVYTSAYVPLSTIGDFSFDLTRGATIDKTKSYGVRMVIDDGTPFRMQSSIEALTFGQGVVGGYGIVPPGSAGTVADELALVEGRYPKQLSMFDDEDVATGYSCDTGSTLSYFLSQDATITLTFSSYDAQGNVNPIPTWTALDNVAQAKGMQRLTVDGSHLTIGDFQYDLTAIASDGTAEHYSGLAAHHFERHDALPLAHPFVKGVDLYSGGAVLSEEDIAIGGRGPGMKLSRTYTSHQGDDRHYFGRGWSSDMDMQVLTNACNARIVNGAAGQGQRFIPAAVDADGTQHFTALGGYHGTLLQKDGAYDFYAKDGTRYHFGQLDLKGPRLSFVEDTNGNRVSYTYEVNQGDPHVKRIDDAAGRHIDLTYAIKEVSRTVSGITFQDEFTVVTDAMGPGGLALHYDYDDDGNLHEVTRGDGGAGKRVTDYGYHDYGGVFGADPDGNLKYFRFGFRLISASNMLDQGTRTYDYILEWSGVPATDGKIQFEPDQRVKTLQEPDGGVTGFVYDGVRGLQPVDTTVTDAMQHDTAYAMNRYGAAETVTDPAGITQTVWDLTHMQPAQVTDALHTITTYQYDDAGNKLSEKIQHPKGTIERTWTYKPQTQFSPPYIRNRVDTYTDGNGISNSTQYGYDTHGNRNSTVRGGITESDGYYPNGDHQSHTDGLSNVWQWRYDAYGTLGAAEDPMHHVTATTFDERGRKVDETDANNHKTSYTYDARDRLLTTTYPATEAGQAAQVDTYDDGADTHSVRNPNGHTTTSSFDNMGRLVGVLHPDGNSRSLVYDFNGNLKSETDFKGNETDYVYDAANRRHEIDAPENRKTVIEYDALGHPLSETVSGPASVTRVTEYAYDHPLYARTLVRRHLDDSHNADTVSGYDNDGNLTSILDAEGRLTTRHYDARDRLFKEEAPYGKVTTTDYYDDDRKKKDTVTNPGHADQITSYEYDAAGRLTAVVDPVNDRRTIGYDNTKNVTSRSDARANLTQFAYNARDQLTQEIGAETGQLTTYTNDLAGNRVTETWPNGNVRTLAYDSLERHRETDDSLGLVEAITYTPDNDVETRTDANNHVTTNHYDGLHRVKQQDLPTVALGERHIGRTYDAHGDVLTETDPGNHTTTHTYDALGRRISTTLPDTDAGTAQLLFDYDLIDRPTLREDARHKDTLISYDDNTHTTTQTDPSTPDGSFTQIWTYDALGNEIAHHDRRGIDTLTQYDAANRVSSVTRGGIATSTRTYEDGRVKTDKDANGHTTTNSYDKAGRKVEEDRPLGFARTWTYWPMGQVHTATDADGRVTTSTYTARNYLETESLHGETTTYGYDGEGHRTSMQRPKGDDYLWQYVYDEGDRLVQVIDPYGVTVYGYDLDGNRTDQTDANLHKTSFHYDARHYRRSLTYPTVSSGAAGSASATAAWTYDGDGNITQTVSANGKTIDIAVDALDRRTSETVQSPDPAEISTAAYLHDGNGNITQVKETVNGAIARTVTRSYDDFDRLEIEHETYADPHVLGKAVQYGYDLVGNRRSLKDVSDTNHTVDLTAWTYNDLNQNDSVTVQGADVTLIDHYPSGLEKQITRTPPGGASTTTTTTYDGSGRVDTITHASAGGEIAHTRYDYDVNGNRLNQYESNGAVTGGAEQTTTYTYDLADRLTDIASPDSTTHYVIDAVGNRTTETIKDPQGNPVGTSTLAYNEREQLVTRDDSTQNLHVALAYDTDGNTKTETDASGTRTSTYDAHDRLLTMTPPGAQALNFDYDSSGLRLSKRQGSAQTRYQYDEQSLMAEANAIGNVLTRYHYSASALIARTDATSERHYLLDALKTPIATLNLGVVDSRTKYDAWGQIVSQQGQGGGVTTTNTEGSKAQLLVTDGQDIGFTGYVKDTETGLYYAKARYYDPRIARFTTEDPEEGKEMQPPSLHRYLYAYANPTVYTDPDGKAPIVPIGYVYTIRGTINGEKVVYTGSAADLKERIGNSNHKWASLIRDPNTVITIKKASGALNVEASSRGTLRSATNEALRSVEQPQIDKTKGGDARVLNSRAAATEQHVEEWAQTHQTTLSDDAFEIKSLGEIRPRYPEEPAENTPRGSVGGKMSEALGVVGILLDAATMARQQNVAKQGLVEGTVTFQDGRGKFFVEEKDNGWFRPTEYSKHYITEGGIDPSPPGDNASATTQSAEDANGHPRQVQEKKAAQQTAPLVVPITKEQRNYYKKEADATLGTTDWKGDFVPGVIPIQALCDPLTCV